MILFLIEDFLLLVRDRGIYHCRYYSKWLETENPTGDVGNKFSQRFSINTYQEIKLRKILPNIR